MPTAEVICTGVTYYSREQQYDSEGDPLLNRRGEEVVVDVPQFASMGDTVELSAPEFERLKKLNAVQEPGAAPLPGTGAPRPTPFSTPVVDPETGEPEGYAGPIMGDPNPGAHVGGLTPEQSAEFAAKAAGSAEDQDADAIANREYDKASVGALEAELAERGIDKEEIEGSGSGGNVVKADLVATLESDDSNQ